MIRQARVTAAYATVPILDAATGKTTVHGFHRDAVFPPNANPDSVAALVRRGYAEWVDDPVVEAPAAAPAELPVEPVVEPEPVAEALTVEAEPAPEVVARLAPPAQNASKADWVTYAVSQRAEGVSEEDAYAEAEAKTKADLIAEFGG